MEATFSIGSTWNDMAQHAQDNSLDTLVMNASFVDTLRSKEPDMQQDEYLSVVEIITDRFHDRFGLSSRQRREVTKAIMNQTRTIPQLYDSLMPEAIERDEP